MTCVDEETATAFAEGRLGAPALTEIEAHAATCTACHKLLVSAVAAGTRGGSPAPVSHGESLPRGLSVGRYVILGLTGRGGVGEVYAAYDSELDRRVALKILHARDVSQDARADTRLLREARAMARVTHPNVVSIHEAGTFDGRVFIAMEFVDGPTLKEWLAQKPRELSEILAAFGMAARGLAAAHAVGLVHRDFKPQNVMMAPDGMARVLDFGLVAPIGETGAELTGSERPEQPVAEDLRLTRTGELLGTPLYMAPEQFRGEPVDARTDQFSFCVALHQALYGVAPFGDTSLTALVKDVLAGNLCPVPARSAVPTWLRRVVVRGLSQRPDERWPSMRALVDALEHDPTRGRARRGLLTIAALAIALTGFAIARRTNRPATICRGGPSAIAGAWDTSPTGSRRKSIRTAFLASGAPAASEVWDRVADGLDRYFHSWLATYQDSCEATELRREQSAAMLDLRMSCLGERRVALRALADVLAKADKEIVKNSVNAVIALPALERCSDLKLLLEPSEPPRDEATRRRVEDLRRRLAVAKALNDAGKHAEARTISRALVEDSRAIAYAPLVAETLSTLSHTYDAFEFEPEAISVREETVWQGIAVGRLDFAADAATELYADFSFYSFRREQARDWAPLASALIQGMGERGERQRSWMLHDEAVIHLHDNDLPGALDLIRRAVILKEKVLPADAPDTALSLNTEADILAALGRTEEAVAINERSYASLVRAYGEASTAAAEVLGNRGEYLLTLGRTAEAVAPIRQSLARLEAQLGDDAGVLGYPLTTLGRAELALGHAENALPLLERALRLREAKEPVPIVVAETRFALARTLGALGRDARARSLATQARAAYAGAKDAIHVAAIDAWRVQQGPVRGSR